MVFLDRINSELNAYGVGFALDETRKSTIDYTEEELQIIRDKIRNFIIQNIDASIHAQVRKITEPSELVKKIEQIVDPMGVGAIYELKKRFNKMYCDPKLESALDFNNRFDDLVERIRRKKTARRGRKGKLPLRD